MSKRGLFLKFSHTAALAPLYKEISSIQQISNAIWWSVILKDRDLDLPCIIAPFRVVVNIVEQTAEVDKDRARDIWRYKMSLHLLWRCKRRNGDGALVQTHMVPLTKCLNQSGTLEQRKNPSFNGFFLLFIMSNQIKSNHWTIYLCNKRISRCSVSHVTKY